MTLSERNTFFKAGIAFCGIITLFAAAASFLIIPAYSKMSENSRRPSYIIQAVSGRFLESNYYAVHVSLVLAVLFSLVGMLLIHYFFERTSTPEILYISFFIFSFSLEIIRLFIPMQVIFNYPFFYRLTAARILLFARYSGIFSLFTAGICAAGMEIQKNRTIIITILIVVLLIVIDIPVDTQVWDTSFKMVNGYNNIFRMMETIAFITTSISFLAAAKIRDSNDYTYAGIGVVLALSGRNILLETDNWAGPVLGILLLSLGTFIICSKLHKIHLWL
jgi:hypothetical protein